MNLQLYPETTISNAAAGQIDLEGLLARLMIPDAARKAALAVLKREEVTALQILSGEVTDEVQARPMFCTASRFLLVVARRRQRGKVHTPLFSGRGNFSPLISPMATKEGK